MMQGALGTGVGLSPTNEHTLVLQWSNTIYPHSILLKQPSQPMAPQSTLAFMASSSSCMFSSSAVFPSTSSRSVCTSIIICSKHGWVRSHARSDTESHSTQPITSWLNTAHWPSTDKPYFHTRVHALSGGLVPKTLQSKPHYHVHTLSRSLLCCASICFICSLSLVICRVGMAHLGSTWDGSKSCGSLLALQCGRTLAKPQLLCPMLGYADCPLLRISSN